MGIELLVGGLIKVLGSAGFGTVFGGIMGFFNRKSDLQMKKLEYEDRDRQRAHELKQRELDVAIMEREAAAKVEVASITAEAGVEKEAYAALAKSYDFAVPQGGSKMASFSSFVRPCISLAYFVISSLGAAYVVGMAFFVAGPMFNPVQWYELAMFAIEWVAFMASTAIGWWFALRAGGTAPRLNVRR